MSAGPKRAGLTLVELLVVLGVIAVLAGLLLPAVQRARESGRRAGCASNLHQLGLAASAYLQTWNRWPLGIWYYSTQVQVLPYLGFEQLYNSLNTLVPALPWIDNDPQPVLYQDYAFDLANTTAMRTRVPLFLCPSDAGPRWPYGGGNNYRLNLETRPGDNPYFPPSAFVAAEQGGAEVVTDGLANTAYFSERVQGSFPGARPDLFRHAFLWRPLNVSAGSIPTDVWIAACRSLAGREDRLVWWMGEQWVLGGALYTWYTHTLPPNTAISDCLFTATPFLDPGLVSARSWHPGGVNVLMADGSVRFFSNDVDLHIWRAISTIDGGEPVAF